ncbi:MAG: winged helix-turn-helix transcriptional regulator [Oscillospiraceae bacterium]
MAKKLGISVNTVAKYVAALEEQGLIRTERTEIITRDGLKRNGCLRYTILPIKNALALCCEASAGESGASRGTAAGTEQSRKAGRYIHSGKAGEQSA